MNLLIVESPNKIKKLQSILGSDWNIVATLGHIIDLPDESLGVDLVSFEPSYVLTARKKTINTLRDAILAATSIFIATDQDREGEAIAQHIVNYFELNDSDYVRVKFSDLSKKSVLSSIDSPLKIDTSLVSAQETRRVLDRLIGFLASDAISSFSGSRLTAGRVQSPALMLVIERQKEIDSFIPRTHFGVTSTFDETPFSWDIKPYLSALDDPDIEYITDKELAVSISNVLEVVTVESDETVNEISPPSAFDTAGLLSESSKSLGLNSKKTMFIAQKLYELGLITYIRTDVRNLSDEGFALAQTHMKSLGYDEYLSDEQVIVEDSNSQEAHEAIRPTTFDFDSLNLGDTHLALLNLIATRTSLSVLKPSYNDVQNVRVRGVEKVGDLYPEFVATRSRQNTPGWKIATDKSSPCDSFLDLTVNDVIFFSSSELKEKVTSPPKSFKEHTLLNKMKKFGIGRPSTYASIFNLLLSRSYITLGAKGILLPTSQGLTVYLSLKNHFDFMDVSYTSIVETSLDKIASGDAKSLDLLKMVYSHLSADIDKLSALDSKDVLDIEYEHPCPSCDGHLSLINNSFWGCSNHKSDGCDITFTNYRGVPFTKVFPCFVCQSDLKLFKNKDYFFGCTSDICNETFPLKSGKPYQMPEPVESKFICPDCSKPLLKAKTMKGKTIFPCSDCVFCAFPTKYGKKPPTYKKGDLWLFV